jgi:iron(III) transport system substrate-binding protein
LHLAAKPAKSEAVRGFAALCFGLALSGCRIEVGAPAAKCTDAQGAPSGEVMIYTSMYRSVLDQVDPILEAKLPGVQVEWLQSGSEKIATRLDAELSAGATSADLVLTSDPFWYERKKREDHLLRYASLAALALPREMVDRDGAYVTSRISTMVVAYNTRLVSEEEAPRSFAELFDDKWKNAVTIPDPLGSGTAFTTLAYLVDVYGEEIIQRMHRANTVAAGGNSSAITRIETGEQKVGFVLLENVLAAKRSGAPIGYRVPKDGAALIPGPIAILKLSDNPVAARAVYDLLLSPEVQKLIVGGDLHSPYEALDPPAGTPSLHQLKETKHDFTPAFLSRSMERAESLRHRFSAIMGGT